MKNLAINKATNDSSRLESKFSLNRKKLNFIWLLASHPTKTFSIDDIVDTILNSGIMIHEKEFLNMLDQNKCRRTGVSYLKERSERNFEYKNKYMNNDFDYL
jgi:hypothetical protein